MFAASGRAGGCLDNNHLHYYQTTRPEILLLEDLMLMVGQKAPEFTLEAMVGKGDFKKISLADYRGKWVVLFFYPLDFTFVCPTEIQEFSKREAEFKKMNTLVLGCSVDSVHSHKAWINSTLGTVSFPILSDLNRSASRDY